MARKLGRGVAIVGAGMSRFGRFPDKGSRELVAEAFLDLKESVDKGFDPEDIEAIYVGNASSDLFEKQGHMASITADWLGLCPKPSTRTEGACASGGLALKEGIIAVASGLHDLVLVVGVEKMTDLPTENVTEVLAAFSDGYYEVPAGFTFPGLYAAMATAYLNKYGAEEKHLRLVGLKNHENGALNPKAQFNMSIRDIMNQRIERARKRGEPIPEWKDEFDFLSDSNANPIIAWPLRLFDCSPITDGAACLLLASQDIAKNFTDDPIYVVGFGQGSAPALHNRDDITSIPSARFAAKMAYEMAGVEPRDIVIAEVHDCFTIAEIVATEDLGFFEQGEGYKAVEEGLTRRDGKKPVNTSGGLKSKGHPVGASGVAQVVEIWEQMRGEAGERQVKRDIPLALTHNVGATGGTCVVHIFERR